MAINRLITLFYHSILYLKFADNQSGIQGYIIANVVLTPPTHEMPARAQLWTP